MSARRSFFFILIIIICQLRIRFDPVQNLPPTSRRHQSPTAAFSIVCFGVQVHQGVPIMVVSRSNEIALIGTGIVSELER